MDPLRTFESVKSRLQNFADAVTWAKVDARDAVTEASRYLQRIWEDAEVDVRHLPGEAREFLGDFAADAWGAAANKLSAAARANPALVRRLQPLGVCLDMFSGAVTDARAHFDSVLEAEIEMDAAHFLRPGSSSCGGNAITRITTENRIRLAFLNDRLWPGDCYASFVAEDGVELTIRCLPFYEVEVTKRYPDGSLLAARVTLGMDEWASGMGLGCDRLWLTRYRHRDFSLPDPPQFKMNGPGRFRSLTTLRFQ